MASANVNSRLQIARSLLLSSDADEADTELTRSESTNALFERLTGIDPNVSAGWAVEIASGKIAASKKNTIFENNREKAIRFYFQNMSRFLIRCLSR